MGDVDIATALDWRGRTVVDRDGEKIGTFKEIYLDEAERPTWASVHTGLFGLRQTFVPLSEARLTGDEVQVPFEKDQVKEAPQADPDVQLSREEEDRLYDHYGMSGLGQAERREPAGQSAGSATVAGARAAGDAAPPASERAEAGGPQAAAATDTEKGAGQSAEPGAARATEANRSEDVAMTRSEEEVTIGKQRRERGRARLKKYVVTDYVEKKVPIQREEVRLEYEPAEGTGQPARDRPPAEPA